MNQLCIVASLLIVLAPILSIDVAAEDAVTFGVLGDYGGGQEVAELVGLVKPDYLISVGDNNYGNVEVGSRDWELQVGDLYGSHILGRHDGRYPAQISQTQRFFPTVGNHDVEYVDLPGGSRAGYLDYFHDDPFVRVDSDSDSQAERGLQARLPNGVHSPLASYYDVRLGDVHLFSLDSQAIVSDVHADEQRAWLEAAAHSSDAAWKFAFFHHPPYSSSQHGSHSQLQWPFGNYGIDAVFSGHDHVYERLFEDTSYFVVGTGGGSGLYSFNTDVAGSVFQYNEQYGTLFFTVSTDTTTFFYMNVEGEIVDRTHVIKDVPEPTSWVLLLIGWLGVLRIFASQQNARFSFGREATRLWIR